MPSPHLTSARSALLLLDFQRDFLSPNGRMPVARHQVEPMLRSAAAARDAARRQGWETIAIGNEFPRRDWLGNLFRKFAAVAGSAGAQWDDRLPLAEAHYFPKWRASAFCNPNLAGYLREKQIRRLYLAGLFASACITATAKAAMAHGFDVTVLADAVADRSNPARTRALRRLQKLGATVITGDLPASPAPPYS